MTTSAETKTESRPRPDEDRVNRLMRDPSIATFLDQYGAGRERTRDAIKYLLVEVPKASDAEIINTVRQLLEALRDERITAFCSYKDKDRGIAMQIDEWFREWSAGDLEMKHMAKFGVDHVGRRWREQIEQAIPDCEWFLLLMPGPTVDRDWLLFEAGYFQPGRNLARRMVCLHHPENEVTDALGDHQTVPAEESKVEEFLTRLFHEPNWIPGMPPINPNLRNLRDKARKIVDLIKPPSVGKRCCGPHMQVEFIDLSEDIGWGQLASGRVRDANDDCRRFFGFDKNAEPESFGDWLQDVKTGPNEGWVTELANAIQVLSRGKEPPPLQSVLSLPEGRFVRPTICAVTRRKGGSLEAVDFRFSEVGMPLDHSRKSPGFAALVSMLEFAVQFRSILERSVHRRPGREEMRAFESSLHTIEQEALRDPRLAREPELTRKLTLDLFEGPPRGEIESMFERWDQLRRPDAKGELDQALEQLDSRRFTSLVKELLDFNQRFLVVVSKRFSEIVSHPGEAWLRPGRDVQPQQVSTATIQDEIDPLSIAVLPFENMSDDPRDLFADGMTEEITSRLAKLDELTVVSRNSVMGYKRTDKPRNVIAQELHVANVLEGSVRREGGRVRITGQLIDTNRDRHLWADTYERELDDVFQVQSEVAKSIVEALDVRLLPHKKAALEKKPTLSITAYDYYLKGMDHYGHYRKNDNEKAIDCYKNALLEDANYALAYAGLAFAHYQRAARFGFPRRDSINACIEAANRAVELDPELAEALTAWAIAMGARGLTREALDAELKAVEHKPNYLLAMINVAESYAEMGRLAHSLRWKRKAFNIDPVSSPCCSQIAATYRLLGMDDKAQEWFDRALELEPDSVQAHAFLAQLYLAQGEDEKALDQAKQILVRFPGEPMGLEMAGQAHWFAGRDSKAETYFRQNLEQSRIALAQILWARDCRDEAEEMLAPALEYLQEAVEMGGNAAWVHNRLAAAHALRDEKEQAYQHLEQATQAGEVDYRILQRAPVFANIRNEDRFQKSITRMKERVTRMRRQVRADEAT